MASYFLSQKAIDDLSAIWEYTFETWSEQQADNYYWQLLEDCKNVAENQFLGKQYPEISQEIFGFKSGEHLIFYRKLNPSSIEVIRILHSRMDLKRRIQD
ncbi:toxin ParE1/3/4 [Algoriphagus boseongensis]|uniref:Toxin n=1 Tax=Algoriphagus boseongensis TaxID=1442587 RepID=A0A4R6T694_9BACT|nr:type II toxin-antitoxin system RelE/ParE family toxin [Algoriphagus boseongensis]TDQ17544.1 toxin ParE1/3/4 [Algoriphagus boseongensis]